MEKSVGVLFPIFQEIVDHLPFSFSRKSPMSFDALFEVCKEAITFVGGVWDLKKRMQFSSMEIREVSFE